MFDSKEPAVWLAVLSYRECFCHRMRTGQLACARLKVGRVVTRKVNGYCLCCGFGIHDSLVQKLILRQNIYEVIFTGMAP